MNWLLAYLDRIKGRLTLAFGIGALGMVAIWGVSSYALNRYAETVSNTVAALQLRLSTAASLETAVVDQLLATREFEVGGASSALEAADSLGSASRFHHQALSHTQ